MIGLLGGGGVWMQTGGPFFSTPLCSALFAYFGREADF